MSDRFLLRRALGGKAGPPPDLSDDGGEVSALPVTDILAAPLSPELVRELLREVIDPELGVNIVDLGLLYDVEVSDAEVAIRMTLTTPGCPLGGYLEDEIRARLSQLPQVRTIGVELVWKPPWSPEAMTDVAKQELGWAP